MKLWLIQAVDDLPADRNDPWDPCYDTARGFVVRAETEQAARAIANGNAGDENGKNFVSSKFINTRTPWLDPMYSTCVELLPTGSSELIIRDFMSA